MHRPDIAFQLGKAIVAREGHDLTIISTGGMLSTAMEAANQLDSRGIRSRVLSMHTLKPIDEEAIISAATETGAIVTLEEHSKIGGLGGAVAEVLAEMDGVSIPFRRVGLPSAFAPLAGSQEYLLAAHGLGTESIVQTVLSLLEIARP
jgi:transketolase